VSNLVLFEDRSLVMTGAAELFDVAGARFFHHQVSSREAPSSMLKISSIQKVARQLLDKSNRHEDVVDTS
jgi:hypothetical protein